MLSHLAHWVADEAADKPPSADSAFARAAAGRGMDSAAAAASAAEHLKRAPGWPARCAGRSVPQQHNGCDCGVFAIKFMECASAGRCVLACLHA